MLPQRSCDVSLPALCVCGVFLLAASANSGVQAAEGSDSGQWNVFPESVELAGLGSGQQLLVREQTERFRLDRTRDVKYESSAPAVATVNAQGRIAAISDGTCTVHVTHAGGQLDVSVRVSGMTDRLRVDFQRDIQPIFARAGCNSGPCHGKARGQNGFQLSLLGFDSDFDFDALTKEARGRRIFPADPAQSLLLRKATAEVPHGGGKRLESDSAAYTLLRQWIANGTPREIPGTPQLTHVSVEPHEVSLPYATCHQLVVTAHYSDGSTRDVTRLAAYQSNESAIASVSDAGIIESSEIIGEAAIMARYEGHIAVCRVPIPHPEPVDAAVYAALPRRNFIDEHVWNKLEQLQLTPSAEAPDHKLLRRTYLDLIGRLPTSEEARQYLESTSTDKHADLIDTLLQRPEFADHWANKWADLLRPNPYRVGIKAVLNFDAWIRHSFRHNTPYDEFVRGLLTARGSTFRNGAVTMFRDRRSPEELATMTSQLFLGIRLECAKCHHHPFEVWGQDDFYSFAAYFARVGRKGTGLSPPISGSEEFVYTSDSGSVSHPITGETLPPRPLFGATPEVDGDDPREELAAWMTSPENDFFAQVMANRVWADLMGAGLVEPVDDLRATNPPSNGPLLEHLGDDFRAQGFDLKALIRRIANSHVYRLSSLPNERNVVDTRNYSRHFRTRLRAEVLLDSICGITGIEERFEAMPPDSTARQLWTHRVDSLFLDAFGRPDPNQDPPCERVDVSTVVQVLHLSNSEGIFRKVMHENGVAAQLAASDMSVEQIIEELYLRVYSRLPTAEERQVALAHFATDNLDRKTAAQDLLWALLNTPEFVYKD